MPWPSHPEPYRLKAELVVRVAAGETLAAVCATPGHPSYASIYAWARRDPAFAADLALARTRGAQRRRWTFHEPTAQALLTRLRAGEPITAILRDPAMPSRRVYAHWRATQGHFAEEVHRLNALKSEEKGRSRRRRYRPFDEALADRLLVRVSQGAPLEQTLHADPELPGRVVLARWRWERPDYDRALKTAILVGQRVRGRAAVRCTPKLTARVTRRLAGGETFAAIGRTPGMPSANTLNLWRRRRSEFAAAIAAAWAEREDRVADQVLDLAEAATPETLAETQARIAALQMESDRLRKRLGLPRSERPD
jgi:hypothetical protein